MPAVMWATAKEDVKLPEEVEASRGMGSVPR